MTIDADSSSTSVDGLLLVDKPTGITSAKAVAIVKRGLGGVKVGHLGTLDPFASGLLPLCLGEGTKLAPYLNTADKGYEGVIRLGVTTDTLDVTGTVVATADPPALGDLDLDGLAASFSGSIEQIPPAFSAIKRHGVPMYKLARRGEAVELEPRRVVVHSLALRPVGTDRLGLRMTCSKGTYVRSLARDLGAAIGCGGVLEELVRTGFGRFRLVDAVALERIADGCSPRGLAPGFVGPAAALADLRRFAVDDRVASDLRAGRQGALAGLERPTESGEKACVFEAEGALVAVVGEADGRWRLERVFRSAASCAA